MDKFTDHLREKADKSGYGKGQCALRVREALAAGGYTPSTWPRHAKDWGSWLLRAGFQTVKVTDLSAYKPLKGDVAVIQATTSSKSGHIQGYDGTSWISDFVQKRGFWPGPAYRDETPDYVVYRP
ncbi:CHAP domain-containing protein [Massilia arenosa]|uniref:CHAP domain-containing protein n=1 Tax=Zemynaea arenosa TaxID=2561931 RepID=A0A4Y9S3V1_9BURK|nr:CHAP domain-containing protein [Massilia arenosa]